MSSYELNPETKKVEGQGHDKELSTIRELFPADTCRHGSTNYCHLEHRDPKLSPSLDEGFSVQTDSPFYFVHFCRSSWITWTFIQTFKKKKMKVLIHSKMGSIMSMAHEPSAAGSWTWGCCFFGALPGIATIYLLFGFHFPQASVAVCCTPERLHPGTMTRVGVWGGPRP